MAEAAGVGLFTVWTVRNLRILRMDKRAEKAIVVSRVRLLYENSPRLKLSGQPTAATGYALLSIAVPEYFHAARIRLPEGPCVR